ncbi:glutamate--cysteine ligase [Rhizobiaceae bacterium BDR2-2]|uniref:Glutamate--cysteine ligase n=1 Tax=Ectorhizobium quercum TaxID=2965071 RepID=A0AAE3MZ01_9HYPH|nr:glutamate--cysteine ligase [Ectorhizobium quercum]MCX8996270.1 glutamate--cysteine ligase [Ectorhizobium quercum]MCX8998691.1 glutamate--cysteine ligase [Ectorhizobium quercum]
MARDTTDDTPLSAHCELTSYMEAGSKPKEQFRIGTEHEKFAFYVDGNRPVPYGNGIETLLEGMRDLLGWEPIVDGDHVIGLSEPAGNGAISIEPGGQFELSGAPLASLFDTQTETQTHLDVLKTVAEPLGIEFLAVGGSPKWTLAETPRMPKSRYDIMTGYMPKVGRHGLDMMYRSATIQVNLDYSSEDDMARKMRVSMKLQSIATALFAASPFTDGKPNGYHSWRGEIWRDTDNTRAGCLPFVFKPEFGFSDYAEWALDVPMYFVIRDGRYINCTDITFRQFLDGALKGRIDAWQPTQGDWTNHLSTLFPDVRLKRFLEMRGADNGPLPHITALPAFWVGLLYDEAALADAEALTAAWTFEDVTALRDGVPTQGLKTAIRGHTALDIAREAVAISRKGLKARGIRNAQGEDESLFLAPLDAIIARKATLAEDMLAAFNGPWNGSVEPVFEAYRY